MSEFRISGPGFYRERTGGKAEIVGRAASGAWIGCSAADGLRQWDDRGTWITGPFQNDLIAPWTEPKKGTVWVNVYDDHFMTYTTRDYADRHAVSGRLACVSVNWTEGEGL